MLGTLLFELGHLDADDARVDAVTPGLGSLPALPRSRSALYPAEKRKMKEGEEIRGVERGGCHDTASRIREVHGAKPAVGDGPGCDRVCPVRERAEPSVRQQC